MEKALKSAKTLEEFNLAVSRNTAINYRNRAEFEKAKERLANDEGLGRAFLAAVLPNSITGNQISAVVASVYGEKIEKAKKKKAAAKRRSKYVRSRSGCQLKNRFQYFVGKHGKTTAFYNETGKSIGKDKVYILFYFSKLIDLEPLTHNPLVVGSSPTGPTN